MILLVCAVSQETSAISRYLTTPAERLEGGQGVWRSWWGSIGGCPFMLLQTGMGNENACTSLESMLDANPVSGVFNFGFGAAAVTGLAVGDVVLCETFLNTKTSTGYPLLHADERFLLAAKNASPDEKTSPGYPELHTGGGLTVDRLVSDPRDKQRLGQQYAASVIDMESYALAEIAAGRDIPFLALRAISDDMNEALPPTEHYLRPDGAINWSAAISRWFVHPADLLRLLRMAGHIDHAKNSLAVWLPGIISLISTKV